MAEFEEEELGQLTGYWGFRWSCGVQPLGGIETPGWHVVGGLQRLSPSGAPCKVFSVPGVLVEDGRQSPIGSSIEVVVVDMAAEIVGQMRTRVDPEVIAFTLDPDNPFAIPSPTHLCQAAIDWIEEAGSESGLAFYSAGSAEPLEEPRRLHGAMAKMLATPPPKTKQVATAGILQDAMFSQPQEL